MPRIEHANGVVELTGDDTTRVVAARCGACGRSWDDTVITSVTPVPSGRCPFEYEHTDQTQERPGLGQKGAVMDPIANLQEQRELAERMIILRNDTGTSLSSRGRQEFEEAGDRLAELVQALDQWRRQGGFDPYLNPAEAPYSLAELRDACATRMTRHLIDTVAHEVRRRRDGKRGAPVDVDRIPMPAAVAGDVPQEDRDASEEAEWANGPGAI